MSDNRMIRVDLDMENAPPQVRKLAEPTPRQCVGCDTWYSTGGQVLGFSPHARRTRVWFYTVCGQCAVKVKYGLGENILDAIEALLLPLTWAHIENLPDGGQLIIPAEGGGR